MSLATDEAIPVMFGPAGTAGAVFEQSFTALATWTVNHNMGRNPDITVLNTGGMVVSADVRHNSVNQAVIYFNSPFTGRVQAR